MLGRRAGVGKALSRSMAVEACAKDTKGQTCYICTQALHWKTKEGLVRGCACRGTAGFAHVSCLAEQAQILVAEAEENNLDNKALQARCDRWDICGLCEQRYHGVVECALGWACWKTYVGRAETDLVRVMAMNVLGLNLSNTGHYEDALPVQEAELSMMRRLGKPVLAMLDVQLNIAITYARLGRLESARDLLRDVYSGNLEILGEDDSNTIIAAANYASSLKDLHSYEEVKSLLRRVMPAARRAFGETHELMLKMRLGYAMALYRDPSATLGDLREAVTTLEDTERTARRVLGGAHPVTVDVECELRKARAARGDAIAGEFLSSDT